MTSLLSQTEALLIEEGCRLVEDSWREFGRRTYLHNNDADRDFIEQLKRLLRNVGWRINSGKLRSFSDENLHEIEIEPGGSEISGHFLHLMDLRKVPNANE
jgi:hypothetical protein